MAMLDDTKGIGRTMAEHSTEETFLAAPMTGVGDSFNASNTPREIRARRSVIRAERPLSTAKSNRKVILQSCHHRSTAITSSLNCESDDDMEMLMAARKSDHWSVADE